MKSKVSKSAKGREKKNVSSLSKAEIGSAFVRIAHKISANKSEKQIIKIGDKYFSVRELG